MSILLQEYSQKDAEDLFNISLEKGIIMSVMAIMGCLSLPCIHGSLMSIPERE